MRARPVDYCFNADPVALKLVTWNKIVFRADMGLCLPKLKCKRNSHCVAVTDSSVLINVSTMKVRCLLFMAANKSKTSPIHGSKRNITQKHYKETKQTSISRKKTALYVLFGK